MTTARKNSIPKKAALPHGRVADKIVISRAVQDKIKNVDTQGFIYVSPSENKWSVRLDGRERAYRLYDEKPLALSAARRIRKEAEKGQIIVYNAMGEISRII